MAAELKFETHFIIILAILITLIMPATSTTVMYTFKCKSNDANSTMTHDSRLKEFEIEANGCALGYKAGSFDYLQKGKIEFEDLIEYHEDYNEAKSDSIVFHNMTVFFDGEKGISEFYAGGFFPNNRLISSNNAIRFEYSRKSILHNSNNNLRNNYSSRKIRLKAEVVMSQARKRDVGYDFSYNATVVNGIIETSDILGWTNITRSRRIDWEQTALMRGNITLVNNLLANDLSNIACGRDWLSCD
jgi:hypothetical protein